MAQARQHQGGGILSTCHPKPEDGTPSPQGEQGELYLKIGKLISFKKIIISGILKVISAAFKVAVFYDVEVYWKNSPTGGGLVPGHSCAGQ